MRVYAYMYVLYIIPHDHVFIVYINPITSYIVYIITFYNMFYAFDGIVFYCTLSKMTRIKMLNQSICYMCSDITILKSTSPMGRWVKICTLLSDDVQRLGQNRHDNGGILLALILFWCILRLSHWGRDKMDAISQTTFSNRFSYTLGREYRVMRNRYSRLLFTSEDRLCANLRVQEQSTNMTSQC